MFPFLVHTLSPHSLLVWLSGQLSLSPSMSSVYSVSNLSVFIFHLLPPSSLLFYTHKYCTNTHACMHTDSNTLACMQTHMREHPQTHTPLCIHPSYMHTCMHVHMCTCTCMQTLTHTHTHTQRCVGTTNRYQYYKCCILHLSSGSADDFGALIMPSVHLILPVCFCGDVITVK